ncbi:MAG: T9SS type A sorting domain-containing protein [Bacteroidota bacterium]
MNQVKGTMRAAVAMALLCFVCTQLTAQTNANVPCFAVWDDDGKSMQPNGTKSGSPNVKKRVEFKYALSPSYTALRFRFTFKDATGTTLNIQNNSQTYHEILVDLSGGSLPPNYVAGTEPSYHYVGFPLHLDLVNPPAGPISVYYTVYYQNAVNTWSFLMGNTARSHFPLDRDFYCKGDIQAVKPQKRLGQKQTTIFPNPASDVLFLPRIEGKASVRLLGLDGRLQLSQAIPSGTSSTLFVGNIPDGIWLLELKQNGRIFRRQTIQITH